MNNLNEEVMRGWAKAYGLTEKKMQIEVYDIVELKDKFPKSYKKVYEKWKNSDSFDDLHNQIVNTFQGAFTYFKKEIKDAGTIDEFISKFFDDKGKLKENEVKTMQIKNSYDDAIIYNIFDKVFYPYYKKFPKLEAKDYIYEVEDHVNRKEIEKYVDGDLLNPDVFLEFMINKENIYDKNGNELDPKSGYIISEAKDFDSLNEVRISGILDYFFSMKKGDKNRHLAAKDYDEMLAEIESNKEEFKRIEVSLIKAGLSGKAAVMTKLGNAYRDLAIQQKKIDEELSKLKVQIPEQIDALFEVGDTAYTMVVETAGGIFTKNKATEKKTVNQKTFILLLEQAGVATELIEKCSEGATKVSNVASSIKFELHQDKNDNSIFGKIMSKIKGWWNSFTTFVKSSLNKIDKIRLEIEKELEMQSNNEED